MLELPFAITRNYSEKGMKRKLLRHPSRATRAVWVQSVSLIFITIESDLLTKFVQQ